MSIESITEFIRAMVRPGITFGLVGAVIAEALAGDLENAKFLATLAGPAFGFWFATRNS